MSIVPRPSGLDTHPVIEGVESRSSFMTEENQKDGRVISRSMAVVEKMTLTKDTEQITTYYMESLLKEKQSGALFFQLSRQG